MVHTGTGCRRFEARGGRRLVSRSMAKLTRKRRGEYLQAVFDVLRDHPDGIQAKDALAEAADRLELSEHEKGTFDDGAPRFPKLVRFQT